MAEKAIEGLVETAMSNLRQMVDANTVVGDVLSVGEGCYIIPLSKVACGFVAGGGEYNKTASERNGAFCGGSGGGLSVTPLGFIAVTGECVRFVPVDNANDVMGQVLENIPNLFQQVQNFMSNKKKNKDKRIDMTSNKESAEA